MTVSEAEQKTHYDSAVGFDQTSNWGIGRRTRNHLRKFELIEERLPEPTNRVLEVGCGSGIHARRLLEERPEVEYIGLDISRTMVEETVRKIGADCIEADGSELPFRDDSFDAVISTATLHHVPDQPEMLSELVRVSRSDGRVLIMEPNFWFPKAMFETFTQSHERHKFNMRRRVLNRWIREIDPVSHRIMNRIYTPPWPQFLAPLYDRIDKFLSVVPGIKRGSMMLFIVIDT